MKIKSNVSCFFPSLSYLPFLALLSLFLFFSSLGVILRPFGVVKSKCIWLFWCKVFNTVFINSVIYIVRKQWRI